MRVSHALPLGTGNAVRSGTRGVDASFALSVATVIAVLCLPAMLNGLPFFYIDSATYLAQGQEAVRAFAPWLEAAGAERMPSAADAPPVVVGEGVAAAEPPVVVAGRSIYYGVLAYLAVAHTNGVLIVLLQAAAVGWPLTLLCRACGMTGGASAVLAGVLAFATPAGLFVGLVTPDVWLAAMGLAVAALLASPGAGHATRAGLGAIVAFAASAHTSHLLVLIVLGAALIACATRRWGARPPGFAAAGRWMVFGAVVGVAGASLFGAVVEHRYGAPPISRPHLTARLTDSGPGVEAARAMCASGGTGQDMAVCAVTDRLGVTWTQFLFDQDPETGVFGPATAAAKRQLSAEDKRFALATLRYAPLRTVWTLSRDAGVQLFTVEAKRVPITARSPSGRLALFPPALAARIEAGRLHHHRAAFAAMDGVHRALLLLSAASLAVACARARRARRALTPAGTAAVVLVLVVVINAVVCGALASPYGRFGARAVWLVVVAAALVVAPRLLATRSKETRP